MKEVTMTKPINTKLAQDRDILDSYLEDARQNNGIIHEFLAGKASIDSILEDFVAYSNAYKFFERRCNQQSVIQEQQILDIAGMGTAAVYLKAEILGAGSSLAQEYISLGTNMYGSGFWNRFKSIKDIEQDFLVYFYL